MYINVYINKNYTNMNVPIFVASIQLRHFKRLYFCPPRVNSVKVQVLVGGALRRVCRPISCTEQNLAVAAMVEYLTPMLTGEGVNQSKIRSKAAMRRERGHTYLGGFPTWEYP